MNTQFFKYALEVERTRSITQAAESLLIAQPNLSKAIKEAEESLGYAIFERTSKGVVPTAKGVLFLGYARDVVKQLRRMDEIAHADDDKTQRLSVSMPRGSYIAKALTGFTASLDFNRAIDMNILETSSMQTIQNVVESRFDLGIIRYQNAYEQYFTDYISDKSLKTELIWEFSYLALMNEKHPLASVPMLTPSALSEHTEIVHGDTFIPYLAHEKTTFDGAYTPKKRIFLYERANQFELLRNIPSTFMWVSPIPEDMLKRYSLVQRRCDFTSNRYKDVLIFRKDYSLSPLEKSFVDKVYESKNEVALHEYE